MQKWLRDAPIRRKLVAFGLAASAAALIVASAVFFVTTFVMAARTTHDNVVAQSAITADNVSAALSFDDRVAAADTLRALRASPSIDVACVWNSEGESFAAYQSSRSAACPAAPPTTVDRVQRGVIELARPITVGHRQVGTLFIKANLNDTATRLGVQAVATIVAFLLGIAVSIVVAQRFQHTIADPLLRLSRTATAVSEQRDYSLRAEPAGHDELGQVIDAFNGMLKQIEIHEGELRSANRLKDEFLATLSHELRTPLNAILGWLQILQRTPPSEERLKHALTSLERNAQSQAHLVEDLLDVSRIVAGKLRIKLVPIDVTPVVDAAIDVVQPAADARGVAIVRTFDSQPHVVKGDPDRLQQAIWNLLANAVKFSDAGDSVRVSLGHTAGEATIVVEDSGAGIEPAFLPHIFEPFRQSDASTTRKYPGLGLGLAIVKEIAQAHGGRIEAFSGGPAQGSRFTLRLPLARAEPADDTVPTLHPGAASILRGVTALVVDDDRDACELAATALEAGGASVAIAEDAATALHLLGVSSIDVLVADLAMPGVDGYELLNRTMALAATTGRTIPAVALTAQASAEEEARARTAGFAAFVRKPYLFEELVDAVSSVARTRKPPSPA